MSENYYIIKYCSFASLDRQNVPKEILHSEFHIMEHLRFCRVRFVGNPKVKSQRDILISLYILENLEMHI